MLVILTFLVPLYVSMTVRTSVKSRPFSSLHFLPPNEVAFPFLGFEHWHSKSFPVKAWRTHAFDVLLHNEGATCGKWWGNHNSGHYLTLIYYAYWVSPFPALFTLCSSRYLTMSTWSFLTASCSGVFLSWFIESRSFGSFEAWWIIFKHSSWPL